MTEKWMSDTERFIEEVKNESSSSVEKDLVDITSTDFEGMSREDKGDTFILYLIEEEGIYAYDEDEDDIPTSGEHMFLYRRFLDFIYQK